MEINWINIKDRLPKEGQRVILFYEGEVCYDYVLVKNYGKIKSNDFFEPYHSGYSCVRTATHWMPIIEPPIIEEKS
jgi:hypothetical protein